MMGGGMIEGGAEASMVCFKSVCSSLTGSDSGGVSPTTRVVLGFTTWLVGDKGFSNAPILCATRLVCKKGEDDVRGLLISAVALQDRNTWRWKAFWRTSLAFDQA
jgi:hypothetical protein